MCFATGQGFSGIGSFAAIIEHRGGAALVGLGVPYRSEEPFTVADVVSYPRLAAALATLVIE
jgi:hypothetical protein